MGPSHEFVNSIKVPSSLVIMSEKTKKYSYTIKYYIVFVLSIMIGYFEWRHKKEFKLTNHVSRYKHFLTKLHRSRPMKTFLLKNVWILGLLIWIKLFLQAVRILYLYEGNGWAKPEVNGRHLVESPILCLYYRLSKIYKLHPKIIIRLNHFRSILKLKKYNRLLNRTFMKI